MRVTELCTGLTQREKDLITARVALKIDPSLSMDFLKDSSLFEITAPAATTTEELYINL